MAIVPGESIKEFTSLKPSTVVVWCLLCEVKQGETVYLELEKAEKYGVKKSAFYHAFNELVGRGWLELAGNFDGRKWWRPVKGFRRDSANVENLSANVESFPQTRNLARKHRLKIPQTRKIFPQTWKNRPKKSPIIPQTWKIP